MTVMPHYSYLKAPPTAAEVEKRQEQQKRDGIKSNNKLRQKLARGKR
jgi:hypothetical protein